MSDPRPLALAAVVLFALVGTDGTTRERVWQWLYPARAAVVVPLPPPVPEVPAPVVEPELVTPPPTVTPDPPPVETKPEPPSKPKAKPKVTKKPPERKPPTPRTQRKPTADECADMRSGIRAITRVGVKVAGRAKGYSSAQIEQALRDCGL